MRRLSFVHLVAAFLLTMLASVARADTLVVFAAASLTNALQDIGKSFEAQSGHTVKYSFAASSTLAKQIESGAQAQLFLSADEQWMDYLAERKLIVTDSRISLLGNSLVLVTPADSKATVALAKGFDLAALLGDGRLATGDPAHVPVGKYAQAALTHLGVWRIAEPRLVRADSVRAALVLVERGEVPAGIVYSTDAAVTPKVRVAATFPADSHAPITYPAAIIAGQDSAAARAFYTYLRSDAASTVFKRYGFSVK
ncbi:molybdate ABC transporter substrate-binding protein [Methyloversatilis thermotolerans]|uniref:molybdate ABC transporter substrate-binding protein n=1 Tax=Methyloversatilis thermotolerans TaxID=1346290 RepID=UPI0003624937|nr:molybdate ABC transporter substrate-binding protein [Methyloversatilis thermotolerans]